MTFESALKLKNHLKTLRQANTIDLPQYEIIAIDFESKPISSQDLKSLNTIALRVSIKFINEGESKSTNLRSVTLFISRLTQDKIVGFEE